MKKSFAFVLGAAVVLVPTLVLAQNFTYVNNWLNQAIYWLRLAITVVMILMTLYFLLNVFKFIRNTDPKNTPELKQGMINGLIGLFVSVAVWGIIGIAGNVLGVDTTNSKKTPNVTCPPGLQYSQLTGTCER